jgi:glutamate-ammonia-ligase adenylyltransferase
MERRVSSPPVDPAGQPPTVAAKPDPKPVLLATERNVEQVRTILSAYHLRNIEQADRNLQSMAGEPHERLQLAKILPQLMDSISRTADPDQALNHWDRLLEGMTRSSVFAYLSSSPRMLDLLCTIFGNSDALAFTMIRDPMLVYWLAEEGVLTKEPTRQGMEEATRKAVERLTVKDMKLEALRRLRRREMLRIGVRDLLRVSGVPETTAALSDLASALIHAAYEVVDADLRKQYGAPMHKNRQGKWVETGFAIMGMGKLGGHELNYSSDVDLIYVYASHEGETRAPKGMDAEQPGAVGISNEEYFEILSRELTKALAEQTKEGHVFRVDLRLRAEGSVGQLARSLDDYDKYYRTRGVVWERLALLKAWPVGGSMEVGQAFLKMVKPFIFGRPKEKMDRHGAFAVVRDVRGVKDMIDAKVTGRGQERRNVKLGTGGIREIEFFVQTIQVIAGKRLAGLLDRNTLGSLDRCARYKLISKQERDELTAAYLFLRDVEHKLQMVDDLQTHTLPDSGEALERCAIRAGYETDDRKHGAEQFHADHLRHRDAVHRMFTALFADPDHSSILKAALRAIAAKG